MCCKLIGVAQLNKPRQRMCGHCAVGEGCRIYESRPGACREFHCRWLTDAQIADHWEPRRSRMVLVCYGDPMQVAIHVDAGRPDAWRKPPYSDQIRSWVANAARLGGQVMVYGARDMTLLRPEGEYNLGPVSGDKHVLVQPRAGGTGWEAIELEADDPRIKGAGK